ncbi:MAG: transposase [Deltaproteobacteria bacterium]|jgi:hypothetical protein|nr:transposase [Deltaproteobacteria bacterium]
MYTVHYSSSVLGRAHLNSIQAERQGTWASDFKRLILASLPMERIRQRYCQDNGRPAKDLRAVTGCLILQHFLHLTDSETCQNHIYDNPWIEALDLGGKPLEDRCICPLTLWEHSRRPGDGGNGDNLLEEIFIP